MKNKLSILVLLLVAALTIPFIQSCKKYSEGPAISFRSKTARLANTWKVASYTRNGADMTSDVLDYTETFTKGGSYSYQWGNFSGTGTWVFQNENTEVLLTGIANQDPQTYIILKLEEKEFWYYFMDGSSRNEFHMIQR